LLLHIENHLTKNNVQAARVEWPNFKIPKEVHAVWEGDGYGNPTSESGPVDPVLLEKMNHLERSVQQVELTETNLQNNYWKLRNKFRTRSKNFDGIEPLAADNAPSLLLRGGSGAFDIRS
jgi:hypothetical protein